MSEQDQREAKELAARAASQGKHSAKNIGRASVAAGEAVADEAVETTKRIAPRISTLGLAAVSSDAGVGFLALSVALYAGAVAYSKFGSVLHGRGRAVTP